MPVCQKKTPYSNEYIDAVSKYTKEMIPTKILAELQGVEPCTVRKQKERHHIDVFKIGRSNYVNREHYVAQIIQVNNEQGW